MIAPLAGGLLLALNVSLPVFVSSAMFLAGAVCAWALPYESAADLTSSVREKEDEGVGEYTLLH